MRLTFGATGALRHVRLLLLGLSVMGCSSGGADDGAGGTAGSGGSGGSGGSAGAAGDCPGDLPRMPNGDPADCTLTGVPDTLADVTGTWALERITPRLARVPGFDMPVSSEMLERILVEHEQTGTDLTLHGTFCFRDNVETDASLPVDVIVPESYYQSIPDFTATGTYEQGADGVYQYSIDRHFINEGVSLDDPACTFLPTEVDDPRVVDQDNDGLPGATTYIGGILQGELHSMVRGWYELEGVPVADDRIEGLIEFNAQAGTLSAIPEDLLNLAVSDFPDPNQCSSFRLVKIPDGSDCTYVEDNAGTLFP